jgi:hypothetical protein
MQADERRIAVAMALVVKIDIADAEGLAKPLSSTVLMLVRSLWMSRRQWKFVRLACKITEKVCVSIRRNVQHDVRRRYLSHRTNPYPLCRIKPVKI